MTFAQAVPRRVATVVTGAGNKGLGARGQLWNDFVISSSRSGNGNRNQGHSAEDRVTQSVNACPSGTNPRHSSVMTRSPS